MKGAAPGSASTGSWLTELRRRTTTLPWLKAAGNAVFLILFFRAYLAIQRNPVFEVMQIPATAIDRWVGCRNQFRQRRTGDSSIKCG